LICTFRYGYLFHCYVVYVQKINRKDILIRTAISTNKQTLFAMNNNEIILQQGKFSDLDYNKKFIHIMFKLNMFLMGI